MLRTNPGPILRLPGSTGGLAEEWFVPDDVPLDHAVVGYTGFAAVPGSSTLLVADARNHSAEGGALYRFDMDSPKGTPTLVPIVYPNTTRTFNPLPLPLSLSLSSRSLSPLSSASAAVAAQPIRPADAIYLPPRYASEVLLITEHDAVSVLRSRHGREKVEAQGRWRGYDGHRQGEKEKQRDSKWRAAEFLGRIPNPAELAASGGLVTAAVEMGGRVYIVEEWFTDPLVPGTSAGNRTSFPLVDVTAQLDALVNGR